MGSENEEEGSPAETGARYGDHEKGDGKDSLEVSHESEDITIDPKEEMKLLAKVSLSSLKPSLDGKDAIPNEQPSY
jgi:hypothetical protein